VTDAKKTPAQRAAERAVRNGRHREAIGRARAAMIEARDAERAAAAAGDETGRKRQVLRRRQIANLLDLLMREEMEKADSVEQMMTARPRPGKRA
jgi:hypothetical protein